MNISYIKSAGTLLLALTAGAFASANTIDGAIGFNGVPILNNINFSLATGISGFVTSRAAVDQEYGDYLAIPDLTPVNFFPFLFSDPTVSPLWSVAFDGKTYSFMATTVSASYNSSLNIWNIGGKGIASITGFEDTPGTWNLSPTNSGRAVAFSSTADVSPVPERSTTLMLLGLGLVSLSFATRAGKVSNPVVGLLQA